MKMKKQGKPGLSLVTLMVLAILGFTLISAHKTQEKKNSNSSPISIDLEVRDGFASFTNSKLPGDRIGYRFFEHVPMILGTTPTSVEETDIDMEKQEKAIKDFSSRDGVLVYSFNTSETSQKEHWIDQNWTFYLDPVEDGIEILLVIETAGIGLPSYYAAQQCFRMSGKTNSEWRRLIAETPAFSEYDLWETQKENEKTSLSWVLRNNNWEELPAMEECVGARTPSGIKIDKKRFNGDLMQTIGPYKGIAQDPVDNGLATRQNKEGTWISGIFWEKTSHITDHHPADCLHSIINVGNIPPYSKRAIRGKIYWFEGTKADLLDKWRNDFAVHDTLKNHVKTLKKV